MTLTISGNNSPPVGFNQGGVPQASLLQKQSRSTVTLPDPASNQQPTEPKDISQAVDYLKNIIERKAPNSLSFSIDEASGKTIVSISDAKTGELIRQIPSEEMLAIAKSLDELQGLLLRQAV
jgi:flagellar protein FlaG